MFINKFDKIKINLKFSNVVFINNRADLGAAIRITGLSVSE